MLFEAFEAWKIRSLTLSLSLHILPKVYYSNDIFSRKYNAANVNDRLSVTVIRTPEKQKKKKIKYFVQKPSNYLFFFFSRYLSCYILKFIVELWKTTIKILCRWQ